MKPVIPSPEIISDLLTENWELRWPVLELFYRIQLNIHHHAPASKEHRKLLQLEKKLHQTLTGPHDQNLKLVMTAAFFLSGSSSIFRLFLHFGIDDSDEFYPELSKIKWKIISGNGETGFFDYFFSLTSATTGVERTTAVAATLAIRLCPPDKALRLIVLIADPELRSNSLQLLHEAWPKYRFNDLILADSGRLLSQFPELIRFIVPPLTPEQIDKCQESTLSLLSQAATLEPAIAAAIGRLKLTKCRPRLEKFDDKDYIITTVSAQMGGPESQAELLAAGDSWRRKNRLAAIPGIAFINNYEAAKLLYQRAGKGDRHECHLAWTALGRNHHPEALNFLLLELQKEESNNDRRLLLKLLADHPRAKTDQATANLLSRWHNQKELYPELLEALAVFGYGKEWESILQTYKPPLLQRYQQETALFMTRFADRATIRAGLVKLLDDTDWCFSFKLLHRLQPYCTAKEFKTLLYRLESYEKGRALTIKERLNKGDDLASFNAALADFLNHNQMTATTVINRFIAELIEGRLPAPDKLQEDCNREPDELKRLLLDRDEMLAIDLRNLLPRLHFIRILKETEQDGCCSLATVVHRIRRYNGYLCRMISKLLIAIINNDPEFKETDALPDLKATIDYIRQRPHYDTLREQALLRIAEISRKARDLKICVETNQSLSLRVISSKRITGLK
jgi:hypothetical protein